MPVKISWPAVGATILPNIGGIAGGFITSKNINPWYEALYEVSALWVNTAAMAIAFYHVSPTAGYLIVPYLAWTTLATALNYALYRDNPPKAIDQKEQR
ncbi:tryptophan-rich sensory protein [Venturia canescens]|uniref:tryptophan-rich sensory protein n=1 Tax=Venturia canescens TaxID=32260 RepID=UPI001C9CB13D|nr:tryptophan-rich sensory protein [Venturia canescens]